MSQRPYQSPRILRCNSPRSLIFVRLVDDNHVRRPVQQDLLLRSLVDVLAAYLWGPALALALAARDDLLPPERLLSTRDEEACRRVGVIVTYDTPLLVEGLAMRLPRVVQLDLGVPDIAGDSRANHEHPLDVAREAMHPHVVERGLRLTTAWLEEDAIIPRACGAERGAGLVRERLGSRAVGRQFPLRASSSC